jgi:hypothetical protein
MQHVDEAHISESTAAESAHVLPTGDPSERLGTRRRDIADAVREARESLQGRPQYNAMGVGHRSKHLQAALAPLEHDIVTQVLLTSASPRADPSSPLKCSGTPSLTMGASDSSGGVLDLCEGPRRPHHVERQDALRVTHWRSTVAQKDTLGAKFGYPM